MKFDLVVRGGRVADGSGAPAFTADVAVHAGRIVAVGKLDAQGEQEIDATGLLVTPGFVDIHTHFDGQAMWDASLAPSAWHGVTTAVMGNCGVGFAPVRAAQRQAVIDLMEGVEDIPGACLHEGLAWNWETFPEYLDEVERTHRDIDLCAQLPHGPLRVWVMGERALRLEPANGADIAAMREITAAAMRAGALGFSTSRTMAHKTALGAPTPMVRAQEDELSAIALGLRDAGHGQIEYVSDWDQPDPATEFAMLRRVVELAGCSCVFTNNQRHGKRNWVWRDLLELSDRAAAAGLRMRPIAAPRPIGSLFGLTGTQNPFSATPTYRSIAHLPLEQRVATMRREEVRRRILAEDPYATSSFSLFRLMGFERMFEHMFLLTDPPDYAPPRERSVASSARREGRPASEVAYDMLLSGGGRNFLWAAFTGYDSFTLDSVDEMLDHPNAMIGLGDAGAHVGFITDASFTTWFLAHWGRDRPGRRRPIEELVRRYTSDPAWAVGLQDRGIVREGFKADLNIIDLPALGLELPYAVDDLPAGGRRLLQKARGYVATIVSGVITYENGVATGERPGRLVRGPRQRPARL